MKSNTKKVWFIVLISVFGLLWLTSLLFLGFATLSDSITKSIETWYASIREESTLNLLKVSSWSTIITTLALVITLLAKELKKKYLVK